jgi:hypothetical protein
MGLFTSNETVTPVPSDVVTVEPRVTRALPDPGAFVLGFLSDLSQESLAAVAAELTRVRHPNGSIPRAALSGVGLRDWKSGPLTLYAWITVKEQLLTSVWASSGLPRRARKPFEATAGEIVRTQGVPAAATWTVMSRPDARCDLEFLGESLSAAYTESAGQITNGDVIKAFRKWRH